MIRFTITLIALTLIASESYCADTFASRLRSAKHIGLSVDEQLSAFTIHIYTPAMFKEHVASAQDFRSRLAAFKERMAGYDRERRAAQERRAGVDELNAITRQRNREAANSPSSPFDQRIKLHMVVSAGDDYISVTPEGEPHQRVLIPLSRVGRVILWPNDESSAASAEPK